MVARHRINLAVLRISDDDTDVFRTFAVLGIFAVLCIKFSDVLFHNLLDVDIQGGNDCISIGRFNDCPLQVGVLIQITELSAVCPAQDICVVRFQPACTAGIASDSDHIARKCFQRIIPDVIFFKPDTLNTPPPCKVCLGVLLFRIDLRIVLKCLLFFQRNALFQNLITTTGCCRISDQ